MVATRDTALATLALKTARKAASRPIPAPADEAAIMRAVLAQIPRFDFDALKRDVWAWLEAQDLKGEPGPKPTEAEIAAAVVAYVNTLDLKGPKGDGVTPDQVMSAVDLLLPQYVAAIADDLVGPPPSKEQVRDVAFEWLALNADALKGRPPTQSEIRQAAIRWLEANADRLEGKPGRAPLASEIRAESWAWLERNANRLKGEDGVGIDRITQPKPDIMRIHLTNGEEYDIKLPRPQIAGRMQPRGAIGMDEARVREIIHKVNPFSGYRLSDEDSVSAVKYYGYVKEKGDDWYIERVDNSSDPITYRYTVDAADYATAWANRATLTYKNLQQVDIP